MIYGQKINICGVETKVRKFTAKEFETLEKIAVETKYYDNNARFQVLLSEEAPVPRALRMIEIEIKKLDKKLEALEQKLESDEGLTETEEAEMLELAALADEKEKLRAEVQIKAKIEQVQERDALAQAIQEALCKMYCSIAGHKNADEFTVMAMSDNEHLDNIREVLRLGKFSLGLSALMNEQERLLGLMTKRKVKQAQNLSKTLSNSSKSEPTQRELAEATG